MKVKDRDLKKENNKFGKELVDNIAPDWVFEDLEDVLKTLFRPFLPLFAKTVGIPTGLR